jgi:hypothetical protein
MSEAAAAAAEDKVAAVEKLTKKRLKIKDAIDTAIQKFSEKLKEGTDTKYASILTELSGKISKVRTEIDTSLVVKTKTGNPPIPEVKKPEPKLGSIEMTKDEVNSFITQHNEDAIFVVTGGSFNPPHNGHIGMFQKAYEALKDKEGKKVYGVMVPASDRWIENKLCKEAHENPDKCTEHELADEKSTAAIKSKRIMLANRVDLCKLSCDSYEWTDKGKFGAENMIVVNDPIGAQGEEFTSQPNTYYLCGSDYYASNGAGPYKFICVLRAGVRRNTGGRANQIHFDKAPITGDTRTSFDVKATDIIIEADGVDNDASSTMLREMLTKINSVVVRDDELGDIPNGNELLKLISIPVLRKLLDLRYILTDTEKNKKVLGIMGINFDEEADKVERAKNMDQVVGTIELNVDIGSDVRDAEIRVTKKFNRIETGGGGDCLFHTLRYLLTETEGKFRPTDNKIADMMTIRNAIVDHVNTLGNTFIHLQVAIGVRLDFKISNEGPRKNALHKDDETAKQDITVDGGVRTDGNMVLFSDRVVIVKDVPATEGAGYVMKYVSQDMTRTYFTVMKEQGTFGTDFELGIAAALYDIPICLITNAGRSQYYIFDKSKNEVRGIEPGEYEKIKNNIRYIYNYTHIHYQYLKCIG